jgi:hypothetical protein
VASHEAAYLDHCRDYREEGLIESLDMPDRVARRRAGSITSVQVVIRLAMDAVIAGRVKFFV